MTEINISEAAMKALLDEIKTTSKIEEMDDRKLLWCLTQTKTWKALDHLPLNHIDVLLFTEAMFRLYPDMSRDGVEHTEWGWKTPGGDVRYVTNQTD